MRKGNVPGRIFGVALAILMIGAMLGGLASIGSDSTSKSYASSSSLPSTIRVLRLSTGTVDTVDFKLYTKRVLPHEWIGSWPSESLKAGAMAAKTYAWYWVDQGDRHPPNADVCDSVHCQVYKEETYSATNNAVDDTWLKGMKKDGQIFESQYWDGSALVDYTDGETLSIRSSPEINDNVITEVPEGAHLAIVDNESVFADGYHWWDVVTNAGEGQRGWAAGEYLRSRWPTYEGETLDEYADYHNLAVRMSQYGSMYLANQGWDFTEILSYYYPGVSFFDISPDLPDLVVEDIWIEPAEFGQGDTVNIWQRTKSVGSGDATGTFRIQRYFDGTSISGVDKNGLAAGASYQSCYTYTWPSDCNSHTVRVVADLYNAITESSEGNNERAESFSAICEGIDLTVTSVNAPTFAQAGDYIAVSWTVKNQGNAPSGSFYNRISLATAPYGTDISLGNFPMDSITTGACSSDTQFPKIPETVSSGYYYVTVFADAFQTVPESDEYNNINKAPSQIHITEANNPPYTPSSPSPANHATGASINVDLSWTGGDPDAGDTVTYDVYFGTSSTPPLVSNDQSGTTYDPGTLAYNTKYYWKVIATDNHAASTTGPLWDFTTAPTSNNPPQLSSPSVQPQSGMPATDFYYYVNYYDDDGDSPSVKQVYIDGWAYTMSLYSGSASNGIYRYGPKSLSFGWGHNYYFYFEDGKGGTARLLNLGNYSGPTIDDGEWDPWVYDENTDGIIQKDEAIQAVQDYFDLKITRAQVMEVLLLYFS
jgi:hypothetical protein